MWDCERKNATVSGSYSIPYLIQYLLSKTFGYDRFVIENSAGFILRKKAKASLALMVFFHAEAKPVERGGAQSKGYNIEKK